MHTPGPWHLVEENVIRDIHGDNIATVVRARDREHIYEHTVSEWPANASLIAAAPALLEALENLHVLTRTLPYSEGGATHQAQNAARAAIAAARGEGVTA